MKVFKSFTGIVAPLDRPNVDTDTIIPKQYLKSIKRTGFGPNLFDDWRYLDAGEPGDDHSKRKENPDFVLNQARYKEAQILLARENFGCGSSREHAVWAFLDYGFSVVIAPSFADIFHSNSFKNGLLSITLDGDVIDKLFESTLATDNYQLTIDLENLSVSTPEGDNYHFELENGVQERLLQGIDDISMTLSLSDEIRDYEIKRKQEAPWLFQDK
ncbi:MAG: 3-isopropylmalate dehydratase small subunit [Proteobacteria bacterium]|nr:3-isopropylmalate dehydratase small subunit [Pseudomonadota bacterium]